MSGKRKAIVALFIVLEALAALGMLALSVHGPSGLSTAAFVYVMIAVPVTWWAGRRFANALAVVGLGLGLLAVVPGIFAGLALVESVTYRRRVAATRVADVRDEAILSTTGRPIGVRISYTVTAPARGYFAILPSLYARDARSERLSVNAARWTIDGSSDPKPFEPGKTHAMVVEMYPPILFFRRSERCLATTLLPVLPESPASTPLRLMISDTNYGNAFNGGSEQLTRGTYDLAELYRGVLAEGLTPCGPP